jgi:hypothetical protein
VKLNGNLTLARLGDEPEPEFKYCTRCDNSMNPRRPDGWCQDCEGVRDCLPRGTDNKRLQPYHPAYEVYLHYPQKPKDDPTIKTLEALRIPHVAYTARKDRIETEYVKGLLPDDKAHGWPIVLITSYGQPVDLWTGYNLNKLNSIPFARAAAINPAPTALDSELQGVPVERKAA